MMDIKFTDCDGYTNFVAETCSGSVIGSIEIEEDGRSSFNELGINELEQILSKMKQLQREVNNIQALE